MKNANRINKDIINANNKKPPSQYHQKKKIMLLISITVVVKVPMLATELNASCANRLEICAALKE